jgi:hypothetical protein
MPDDPKNPNAWWAVHIRLPKMPFSKLNRTEKKRLIWAYALGLLLGSVGIFYLIKLMRITPR